MTTTTSTFVPLRDDSGLRSLSSNERTFLRQCALAENSSRRVLRTDGRKPGEVRQVQLHLSRWHNGAECTVQWGKGTRVTAFVTASLIVPSPDRPSEGVVSLSVDLSPMASIGFSHAQPISTTAVMGGEGTTTLSNIITDETQKLSSNRILRSLERTLLLGGALDTEALCVQSGAWVWKLTVSLTVLDHGGNLLDASVLAAVAALRHYRKPQVDLQQSSDSDDSSSNNMTLPTLIHSDVREPTPLPLHHTPLSMTFALIHADDAVLSTSSTVKVAALVDPTDREELVQTGVISLAMNVHSEVCLLDFGGGCELQPAQLKQCWRLAETSILQLCQMLETTLSEADMKAQQERLHRLQEAAGHNLNAMPAEEASSSLPPNVPYLQDSSGQDFMDIDTTADWKDVSADVAAAAEQQQVEDEAEEAYRLQALDYSLGHVAAKVKDNTNNDDEYRNKPSPSAAAQAKAGSLLAAMLQSAQLGAVSGEQASAAAAPAVLTTTDGDVDMRPAAAQDEFEQFVANAKTQLKEEENKKSTDAMATGADSDDEEETTTMLQSEFQQEAPPKMAPAQDTTPAAAPANNISVLNNDNNDEDIDDLAMAVKKKKSSKKKKKTK